MASLRVAMKRSMVDTATPIATEVVLKDDLNKHRRSDIDTVFDSSTLPNSYDEYDEQLKQHRQKRKKFNQEGSDAAVDDDERSRRIEADDDDDDNDDNGDDDDDDDKDDEICVRERKGTETSLEITPLRSESGDNTISDNEDVSPLQHSEKSESRNHYYSSEVQNEPMEDLCESGSNNQEVKQMDRDDDQEQDTDADVAGVDGYGTAGGSGSSEGVQGDSADFQPSYDEDGPADRRASATPEPEDSLVGSDRMEVVPREKEVRKRSKKGSRQPRLIDELPLSWSKDDNGPPELARQTSRAAALAAKNKLKLKSAVIGAGVLKEKEQRRHERQDKQDDDEDDDEESDEEDKKAQWVQCDRCQKWRKLPSDVEPESLPDAWDCSMMTWSTVPVACAQNKDEDKVSIVSKKSVDEADPEREVKPPAPVRRPKGSKKISKAPPTASHDNEEEEPENSAVAQVTSKKGKGSGVAAAVSTNQPKVAPPVVVNITWVECQNCHKWRKVPGHLNETDLPDVWICSQNYWAPLYANCSAKQEEEDKLTVPIVEEVPLLVRSASTSNAGKKSGARAQTEVVVTKKVTQWVQCERKDCSKWRKVPSHIDMSTFSDNWFCEHNFWDPDKNKCSAIEESDSEEENQQNTDARTQLILANSKGPGQLSYRRLIFGPDGRIKQHYSEKNKLGYGIFSYTEYNKAVDGEEQIPAVKKLSYWASDCYDQTGAQFTTAYKKKRYSTQNLNKRIEQERLQDMDSQLLLDLESEKGSFYDQKPTHLLDAIRRVAGWDPPKAAHPLKAKLLRDYHNMNLNEKLHRECSVVRSCMLSFDFSTEIPVAFSSLLEKIVSCTFLDSSDEVCRKLMGLETLKDTVRTLENNGEAEVTENITGERFVRLIACAPQPHNLPVHLTPALAQLSHLPLKFRKAKYAIPADAI